jgi:hypothetical protein
MPFGFGSSDACASRYLEVFAPSCRPVASLASPQWDEFGQPARSWCWRPCNLTTGEELGSAVRRGAKRRPSRVAQDQDEDSADDDVNQPQYPGDVVAGAAPTRRRSRRWSSSPRRAAHRARIAAGSRGRAGRGTGGDRPSRLTRGPKLRRQRDLALRDRQRARSSTLPFPGCLRRPIGEASGSRW